MTGAWNAALSTMFSPMIANDRSLILFEGSVTILIWPLGILSQHSHGIGTSDGNGKSYKTSTGA